MFDFKDDGEILYDGDDVEKLRKRMNQKREQLVRQQTLEATDPTRARDEAIINEVLERAKKSGGVLEELGPSGVADKKLAPEDMFGLLNLKAPNNIENDLDMEIQKHLNDSESEDNCCGASPSKNVGKLLKDLQMIKNYHKVQAKMMKAYIEKIEGRLRQL
nr:hypothetical protein K-LCC10_0395 [Kaumoebavirus]